MRAVRAAVIYYCSQLHVCADCGQNWPRGHAVQLAKVALIV
jgi:hypothetical protein